MNRTSTNTRLTRRERLAVGLAALLTLLVFGLIAAQLALAQAPNTTPVRPPGLGNLDTILNWLTWGGIVFGVVGLIGCGIALAIENKQGGGGGIQGRIGYVMAGVLLIGAAPGLVNALI
jgi:hypothetical protein